MTNPKTELKCPLCGGDMTVIKTATGVMVKCYNPCVSYCHENVYGHGRNEKEAHEIAKEKFRPLS